MSYCGYGIVPPEYGLAIRITGSFVPRSVASGREIWTRMRSFTPSRSVSSSGTSTHTLLPGHHLQAFLSDRFNPHRILLQRTPFWREGWALCWELELWDRGFARTAPPWDCYRRRKKPFGLKDRRNLSIPAS
jgi:hypothetical protein